MSVGIGAIVRAAAMTVVLAGSMSISASAQEAPTHIQWRACENMPAQTDRQVVISTASAMSQVLPYTVPAGKRLELGTLQLGDKYGGVTASYLTLLGITSVPSTTGTVTYNPAFRVPPEFYMDVHLINNSNSSQWMCLTITATLVDLS